MTIESIRVSMLNYQRVVILKEKEAERYLPIWIGPAEADAIAVKLQEYQVPRPLTHDLLGNIIGALGAAVSSIIVCDLRNDTFFAKIVVEPDGGSIASEAKRLDDERPDEASFVWRGRKWRGKLKDYGVDDAGGRVFELVSEDRVIELWHEEKLDQWLVTKLRIDSRPSDAIALAVRGGYVVRGIDGAVYFKTKAEAEEYVSSLRISGSTMPLPIEPGVPIFAEESVLDKAGIIIDPETGKPAPARDIPPEELERMSAFREFIESLDLSDFDKGKPEA